MKREPIHLGDGAYASQSGAGHLAGEFRITADHHDPLKASNVVHLDEHAMIVLCEWWFQEDWKKMDAALRSDT